MRWACIWALGFSAGLFDYLLNFGIAQKPLLLLPVGLLYFVIYYGLFSFFIRKFDLQTMGREDAQGRRAAVEGSSRAHGFILAWAGRPISSRWMPAPRACACRWPTMTRWMKLHSRHWVRAA
jgi:hypothetical protein